jgi:hypothetical protein
MMHLEEPLNVKSLKSQFTKNYHTRRRTKYDGSDKLGSNSHKPSKVKYVKSHVALCSTAVKKECFCLQLGFIFKSFLKKNSYAFQMQWRKHTDVTKYPVCF